MCIKSEQHVAALWAPPPPPHLQSLYWVSFLQFWLNERWSIIYREAEGQRRNLERPFGPETDTSEPQLHRRDREDDRMRRTTGGKTGLTSDQDQDDVMNLKYSQLIGQKQQFCLIHTVLIQI